MTHDEAMRYWFGRVDYERRSPQPGDLKLDHMRLLLERLGRPQDRFRIVHLAGSKGKGSTSALLAAVLRAEGYRVGLFTSPHLERVEERVQVDGEPIGAVELAARLDEIRAAAAAPMPGESEPLEAQLTFFEIATALGLLHFACRRVDWAVLEVGLGGRFDSTNVCEPRLAVITSISLDHMQMLGDTLAAIAREKVGIVKRGRPTVSGVLATEAMPIIEERCQGMESPLRQLGRDFHFVHWPARIGADDLSARVQVTTWRRAWPVLDLNLVGAHQAANAAVAIAALEVLEEQGLPLSDAAVGAGLARVTWPGRLEVVGRRPLLVIDCAHNVASAHALREALATSFPIAGRRRLIFAGSRDKDLVGMLAVLQPMFDAIYFTRYGNNPRCASPEQLREMIPPERRRGTSLFERSSEAFAAALREAGPDDMICITGSVFLAGELRHILRG